MRTHRARAKPMSMVRAARNGNASFDMSADVIAWITSRERGPWTLICASADVTSVANARSSPMCRRSHACTWPWALSDATTRKRSSSSLVTVRSASSVPPSFSHCV